MCFDSFKHSYLQHFQICTAMFFCGSTGGIIASWYSFLGLRTCRLRSLPFLAGEFFGALHELDRFGIPGYCSGINAGEAAHCFLIFGSMLEVPVRMQEFYLEAIVGQAFGLNVLCSPSSFHTLGAAMAWGSNKD